MKRLEGKPFALLGVNTDGTAAEVKEKNAKENITWRSWFDGKGGPICKQYRITGFPTIFVLDGKGVIRFKEVRGEEMDKAVDKLLKEVESGKSQK